MPKVPLKEVMAWLLPLSSKIQPKAYTLDYFIWWNESLLDKYGIRLEEYLENLESLGFIEVRNNVVLVLPKVYNDVEDFLDGYIVVGGENVDKKVVKDKIVERTLFLLSLQPFGKWTLDIKEEIIGIPIEELHKILRPLAGTYIKRTELYERLKPISCDYNIHPSKITEKMCRKGLLKSKPNGYDVPSFWKYPIQMIKKFHGEYIEIKITEEKINPYKLLHYVLGLWTHNNKDLLLEIAKNFGITKEVSVVEQ